MGEGKLGAIGVDLKVLNRWSMEIPEALAVVREVLIVLIWHSMKPIDLGRGGGHYVLNALGGHRYGKGFR